MENKKIISAYMSELGKRGNAALTPEQRSEMAKKAWKTKKAKQAKAN